MKIRIESTDQITTLQGVECRVWKGITEQGTPCFVFVHRLAVHNLLDSSDFDRELDERLQPGTFFPLRQVLK